MNGCQMTFRCAKIPTARDLRPVYPAKRVAINNIDKSPFIFRLFKNQNPTAENKRIMSRFPQVSVRQLNTPTTPTSPTKPTTHTLPIFSIQRPVASRLDAKRRLTSI